MSLTLSALFDPLNGLFLSKFGAPPGASVMFRLDKVGSVLSDQDFVDPSHPDLGVIPALAVEKLSDLVNRLPVDCGDGINVLLSQRSIDDTYFYHLLNPSVAHVPDGVSGDAAQALTDAFMTEKSEAVRRYSTTTLASASGLLLEYKPSTALPQNWYDPAGQAWTSCCFDVTAPAQPRDNAGVWALRPDIDLFKRIAPEIVVPVLFPPDRDDDVQERLRLRINEARFRPALVDQTLNPGVALAAHAAVADRPSLTAKAAAAVQRHAEVVTDPRLTDGIVDALPNWGDAGDREVSASAVLRFSQLDVRDRLRLGQEVVQEVPVKPATTDAVHISFDYCVVTITRPWLMRAFLTDTNWSIPGAAPASLSGTAAANGIWAMPIGMVVIRNLVITAQWDAADVGHSQQAMSFGPFKINSGIVDGAIRSSGLQSIGWLLDMLPPLPPR